MTPEPKLGPSRLKPEGKAAMLNVQPLVQDLILVPSTLEPYAVALELLTLLVLVSPAIQSASCLVLVSTFLMPNIPALIHHVVLTVPSGQVPTYPLEPQIGNCTKTNGLSIMGSQYHTSGLFELGIPTGMQFIPQTPAICLLE